MTFPAMPTRCRECNGTDMSLDHAVRLNHVVGPIEAWDEVWLGCNDCSATMWNGKFADFMKFINDFRTNYAKQRNA